MPDYFKNYFTKHLEKRNNSFYLCNAFRPKYNLQRKGKHYVGIYYTYKTSDQERIERFLPFNILRPDPIDRDFLYPFGLLSHYFFSE